MFQDFYKLGALQALRDAGLLDKDAADAMHPVVQKGLQDLRTSAMASGNRYAKGYYPNVPMNATQKAMARPAAAAAPAASKPVDYSSAIGAASDKYTNAIASQGRWTR